METLHLVTEIDEVFRGPMGPGAEWESMIVGRDRSIHPLDDDLRHLGEHLDQLLEQLEVHYAHRDHDAVSRLVSHIRGHQIQSQAKALMAI